MMVAQCVVLKVYMARWLSWLERRPVTAEVVGSSPIRVAYADMAQLAEQLICNQQVIGSSPIIGFLFNSDMVKP
jgi:hypothetical protein